MKPIAFSLGLAAILTTTLSFAQTDDNEWYQVSSADGMATVMFPVPLDPEKVDEFETKIPGGKGVTKKLIHRDDNSMFSISGTEFHGMAKLKGVDAILERARAEIISRDNARQISFEAASGFTDPKVMLLKYEIAETKFDGFAVLFLINKKLYVIDSQLKQDSSSKAREKIEEGQARLLQSLKIAS